MNSENTIKIFSRTLDLIINNSIPRIMGIKLKVLFKTTDNKIEIIINHILSEENKIVSHATIVNIQYKLLTNI